MYDPDTFLTRQVILNFYSWRDTTETHSIAFQMKTSVVYTSSTEPNMDQRWQIFARFKNISLAISQPKAEADEMTWRMQLNGVGMSFLKHTLKKF